MSTPFDDVQASALHNRTQVINAVEEHISELELHLGAFPGPYDPLNGAVYIRWERLAMNWIGRVTGNLEAFKLSGLLPPEQYDRLKLRAMAKINHMMTHMVMTGGRQ